MATRTLSLFAGCGTLDLAVRLALSDSRTVCYVERELSAARILAARIAEGSLDDAPIWSDVRTFDARRWRGAVDCIAGGFPCQDISVAGRGEGIVEGNRSGLWFEFARIIREIRPRLIILENVGAIVIRGLDAVLGDLAALGYDAEWMCLRASDVGASHRRERWFCVAYANSERRQQNARGASGDEEADGRAGWQQRQQKGNHEPASAGADVANGAERGCGILRESSVGAMEDAGRAGIGRAEESAGIEGQRPSGDDCGAGRALGDPAGTRLGSGESRAGGEIRDEARRAEPDRRCDGMADAGISGLEERGCIGSDDGAQRATAERDCEPMADSSVRQFSFARRGPEGRDGIGPTGAELPIFAPGPSDPRWPEVLVRYPWLQPAISQAEAEQAICMLADGFIRELDGGLNGKKKAGTCEILCRLWIAVGAQAYWRQARRSWGIRAQEILQSSVYGNRNGEACGSGDGLDNAPSCEEQTVSVLRQLLNCDCAACSPHRRRLQEQRSGEDAVCKLPFETSPLQVEQETQEAALHCVPEAELPPWAVRYVLNEKSEAWNSLGETYQKWVVMGAIANPIIASRTDSLRALGNSVVAIQGASAIGELLRRIG